MYGRKDASALAASIEDLLTVDGAGDRDGSPDRNAALTADAQRELEALVAQLDRLISLDRAV